MITPPDILPYQEKIRRVTFFYQITSPLEINEVYKHSFLKRLSRQKNKE